MVTAFMFSGCNSSSGDTGAARPSEPVEPVQPVEPVEPPEVGPSIPTAGIGSIKGDLDCSGGTISTKYSFGNVGEDDKSFVIQYQRNGAIEDLVYPSTTHNGSRATVQDVYYVRQNDDDHTISWIVTIAYQTPDQTYSLVTTSIKQPECDDNATALNTSYIVY